MTQVTFFKAIFDLSYGSNCLDAVFADIFKIFFGDNIDFSEISTLSSKTSRLIFEKAVLAKVLLDSKIFDESRGLLMDHSHLS